MDTLANSEEPDDVAFIVANTKSIFFRGSELDPGPVPYFRGD